MTPGTDLPDILTLRGSSAGPRLALLGGVHGDEPEGVLAVRRVVDLVQDSGFRGELVYAAPAHPVAWEHDSRLSPVDSKNLAREFPGDVAGAPTERVAGHLTRFLIQGSDLLIDLHSGGRSFDMPLLAGYLGTGPLAEHAGAAALAFGAPILWEHPESGAGRSLSAATALGVPSFYAEARGGGRLRQVDLDAYVDGVLRVMVHLGMLEPGSPALAELPPRAEPPLIVTGDGNTDAGITAPSAGLFVSSTRVGATIERGAPLGLLLDERGGTVAQVPAPHSGVVMLLRRRIETTAGDTLAIVAQYDPTTLARGMREDAP